MLNLNRELCNKDGICVAECPRRILLLGEDGFPTTIPGAEMLCAQCGHCVAVCPTAAMALTAPLPIAPDDCPPVQPELAVNTAQVRHLLKTRRSIRAFKKQPVEREHIQELLDTARFAPTASNVQPLEWVVVHDTQKVHEIGALIVEFMRESGQFSALVTQWDKGVDMIMRGAPHLLVAHAPTQGFRPDLDGAIATTYVDLTAHTMGLGACWAGFVLFAATQSPPVAEALGIPEGRQACGGVLLGRPKYKYHRIPPRNEVKATWL